MAGYIENAQQKIESEGAGHLGGQACAFRLHGDCDLVNPALRKEPVGGSQVATLDFSAPPSSTPEVVSPAQEQKTEERKTFNAEELLKSEDAYMKAAPEMYRGALGLPKDASSKELVEKYLDIGVQTIESAPKDKQAQVLQGFGIDDKTASSILGRPDADKKLNDLLLEKTKAFLEIPPTLKGEAAYKAAESGIEHNDYRLLVDTKKLRDEMSKP